MHALPLPSPSEVVFQPQRRKMLLDQMRRIGNAMQDKKWRKAIVKLEKAHKPVKIKKKKKKSKKSRKSKSPDVVVAASSATGPEVNTRSADGPPSNAKTRTEPTTPKTAETGSSTDADPLLGPPDTNQLVLPPISASDESQKFSEMPSRKDEKEATSIKRAKSANETGLSIRRRISRHRPEMDVDSFLMESEAGGMGAEVDDDEGNYEDWMQSQIRIGTTFSATKKMNVDSENELDLKHFGLGSDEINMLNTYLAENTHVQTLCLRDNRISYRCAEKLSEMIMKNKHITELDLSDNSIRSGMDQLAEAMRRNGTIQTLSLKGNKINKHLVPFCGALETNRMLKRLDLSDNDLDDEHGALLGMALQKNRGLEELKLDWNRLAVISGDALGQMLKWHKSLKTLSLAFNNLGCEGIIALAEGVSMTDTLELLDLTRNRLSYEASMILAEHVRLNTSINHVVVNQNPLGVKGTHLMFIASEHRPGLDRMEVDRVQSPPHTQVLKESRHFFNMSELTAHYILDLSKRWDHSIAVALCQRVARGAGEFYRMCLNEEPILIESKNATIPLTGYLSFDFVTSSTLTASNNRHSAHKFEQSGVHYSLDLSAKDDRKVTAFEYSCSRARLPLHRSAGGYII